MATQSGPYADECNAILDDLNPVFFYLYWKYDTDWVVSEIVSRRYF